MHDLGTQAALGAAKRGDKAKSSTWQVYKRLLSYALRYKFRLIVSILFAVIVAGSFSSVILSCSAFFQIIFGEEAKVAQQLDFGVDYLLDKAYRTEEFETDTGEMRQISEPKLLGRLLNRDRAKAEEALRSFAWGLREDKSSALKGLSVAVLVFIFVGGVARFFQEYFAGGIGASISVRLAQEMYDNVINLSLPFFESRTSGEIVARFTNDVYQVNRGLTGVFVKVFREPIKAVFFLGVALSVNWQLTLVVLVVMPLAAFVILSLGKMVKRSMRRSLQRITSMASVVAESISGAFIVKSFCMERYEMARVNKELTSLRRYLLRTVRANAAVAPITEFVLACGFVALILVAGVAVQEERIEPGELVALFGALAAMADPLRKLAVVNNMVQASVASAERVFEYIDMRPEIVERPGAEPIPPLQDRIRFENVHFSYGDNAEVLEGIDLEVRKGEMVAIVGFSGAGKSTLVKLLPRFYDVTEGQVTFDGRDIREATLQSLRDQISVVTQHTILFAETVRDNIAFGRRDYPYERVRAAAEAAHAHEFIEKLPQGYDTMLGESGGTLSGGQRQRLAIARAIIKDPAVLILDEATSSLDSESERAIQKAIEEFVVGRTTIVIAHRLSTIQRADRIVVLDEGRIAEQGTHEELLEKGGIYCRLYETQFAVKEPRT